MPVIAIRNASGRLRGALAKSATLIVNSGALAAGTFAMAAIGFVYWWLAARTFPPEAIGRAAAVFSVLQLIGLLSEGGLGTLLIGEIPRDPARAPGLVGAAIGVGLPITIGLSLAFLAGEAYFIAAPPLLEGWLYSAMFVAGACLTGVTTLGCQALLGKLRAAGRMAQQVLFALIKLALLGVAIAVCASSDRVLVLTSVAGLAASWIVFDLVTGGQARSLVGRPDFALLATLRRKIFDHYALDVTIQAPGLIMPYLVVVLLSPATNAAFASLWMLVSMASAIPAVMATALFPVTVSNPRQARHDMTVSLSLSLGFSAVVAAIVLFFSRELLALFNPAYPDIAGDSLRLLGFSLFGSALKAHLCALARLNDWMRAAARWFVLGGALEFAGAVLGARYGGLQGLVVGWTVAVSIEGIAALVVFASMRGPDTVPTAVGPEEPLHDGGPPAPFRFRPTASRPIGRVRLQPRDQACE